MRISEGDAGAMAEDLPWLTKLYPGMLFTRAAAVFMTFSKSERPIELFGKNATGSMDLPTEAGDKNNIVLLDECDLYCTALFSSSVDDAVKYDIDLLTFILEAKSVLYDVYDKNGKIQLPDEMLSSEHSSVDTKERIAALIDSIRHFCREYQIHTDSYAAKYAPELPGTAPLLNTLSHRTTIIGGEVSVEDKKESPLDIRVFSEAGDSTLKLVPSLSEEKKSIKGFIQEATKLIDKILGLIRVLYMNTEANNPGMTSVEAIRMMQN